MRGERSYGELFLYVGTLRQEAEQEIVLDVSALDEKPVSYIVGGREMIFSVQPFGGNTQEIPQNQYTKWFDYDKIKGVLLLKTPEAEDIISLYTDGRGKRVLEVLKEAKVPKEKRERQWVLAEGHQVLWIPGIRGSEAYRVTEDTKRVLIATIRGGNKNGR